VEIAHMTDTHINYNNAKDINENEASIRHQYETSAFYGEAKSSAHIIRAMEYASLMDKVVITGDIIHALNYGSLQVANRIMFGKNTWVGIREQKDENGNSLKKVLGTLGNHERYKHMIGKVPDDNYMTYNYSILQEYFPNDIVYHSEIMTNPDGKNPVMLVLLDDQRERYEDEIIREKLAADLAKARDKNVPVLIFQHVGLYSGDETVQNTPGYTESASTPNLTCPGGPKSTELTKQVYNLITDNADIVRGIFCGHEHVNCYKEIIGTGENGSGHVIPQNYLDTCQDDKGYIIKIIVK
ncbi:MAG: metallophosphoesterase, partial [Clostridia bacterium]|nr:metallophosphoesterase [Clostridia bacterium]